MASKRENFCGSEVSSSQALFAWKLDSRFSSELMDVTSWSRYVSRLKSLADSESCEVIDRDKSVVDERTPGTRARQVLVGRMSEAIT